MRAIMVLALAILLFGCTENGGNGSSVSGTPQETGGESAPYDLASCLSDCDGLSGSILNICQSSCYQEKAIAEKNADGCAKVGQLMNSTTAHEVCLEEVAIALGSAAPCEKLDAEFSRDMCYITVADALGDVSICDRVSDDDVKLTKQDCINKVG